MSRMAQAAANALAAEFSSMASVMGNIWGLQFQDGSQSLAKAKASAAVIGRKFGVTAISFASQSGVRMVAFTSQPEATRVDLSNHGKRMEILGQDAVYGQPLYGGSWTCAGNDCLTEKGTPK